MLCLCEEGEQASKPASNSAKGMTSQITGLTDKRKLEKDGSRQSSVLWLEGRFLSEVNSAFRQFPDMCVYFLSSFLVVNCTNISVSWYRASRSNNNKKTAEI